jgi:hypothetical protein
MPTLILASIAFPLVGSHKDSLATRARRKALWASSSCAGAGGLIPGTNVTSGKAACSKGPQSELAKHALADLLTRLEHETDIPGVTQEQIDTARQEVARDMGW